ncbi:amino acid ABC transporter permease [Amylolactobacillus amylotrophicus DSM 20534]|uniref:Amino acid ABC transporter permease n=3 Tax=Amylolactobacillus TaxID=2767876 RepID=A0A0R1YQG2_9LACO|nr:MULTISPECIES: amino acid ABC transporter permease [Amylolactobacillus]APT18737.1 glutamine ABC transporter permease [Amylolactobacillus amylophilus DSM 20533 = JCM 1125]KRK37026.1 amino acid ABC transporter permease [Amylolactobacillus amylotrophicus DSM 20534]KRM41475.1 amino acid ABC transporter permease [Amylolactobacillus amylophilus DSM 20533 = JCM 1125]GED80651.1 glutamine ABC transporter permease [Amylolactobacillus amylophilus]
MIEIFQTYMNDFISGLGMTIFSSILAFTGSLFLGIIFALFEINPNKILRIFGSIYVEIFRNIPLLVVTMFFYIVIPKYVTSIDGFTAGTIGLLIYTSAFFAEVVKAGIQSVPTGQWEAARANGMTYMQGMIHVIFPQAIKIVIPPLGNQTITLVKNSSVLAFVAGFDLMYQANQISSITFQQVPTYFIVGILYLIVTMPLSYLMRYLERRWEG